MKICRQYKRFNNPITLVVYGPGIILILCGLVGFTTGRFILSLALLFVLVFFPRPF